MPESIFSMRERATCLHKRLKCSSVALVFLGTLCLVWTATSGFAGDEPLFDEAAEDEDPIADYERDHWAYHPIEVPAVPEVRDTSWSQTNIDRFLLAEMEDASLRPAPPTDKESLLRRVAFDLTGLPVSPQARAKFLNDSSPLAYERLVDQLLASPQYGRRWGQYWLDLARFAETDGYEHDKIRPTAWKYRDWVIQALCEDLPYDEFVKLQIAGDIVAPDDPDAVVATAFCLSGPDMPDINSQTERKHVLMNEVTSTVGSVFLSLQFGCAQCHDHKYDAIRQADFYRLRAYFEPSVKLAANKSVTVLKAAADPKAEGRVYRRGDWRYPGPKVIPAIPTVLRPVGDVSADDNRLSLAEWLTDPSNPLVARSIVNRIWQFHFGRGISSTPSDFGVIGDSPSNPELLDYLAAELIRNDWSLKYLHRQIALSSVYQTASLRPESGTAAEQWDQNSDADPDNILLTRFPRRRLDAESLRDAILAASDSLNNESGGPGVSPPLPTELVKTLKSGQWKVTSKEADHFRRSIYLFSRRNLRYPLFATFDRPAANCSCAIRHESTTAVQSLMLLNSEFTYEASERLTDRLMEAGGSPESHVRDLYQRVYGRLPSSGELADCVGFLGSMESDSYRTSLIDLCRVVFNSNQFLYVD